MKITSVKDAIELELDDSNCNAASTLDFSC